MREPASGPPEFGCREWSCQVVGEVQAGLKVSWEAYTTKNGLLREQDSVIEGERMVWSPSASCLAAAGCVCTCAIKMIKHS